MHLIEPAVIDPLLPVATICCREGWSPTKTRSSIAGKSSCVPEGCEVESLETQLRTDQDEAARRKFSRGPDIRGLPEGVRAPNSRRPKGSSHW